MVKDATSNLITSLKNASMVGKSTVVVPFSNMSLAILELLKKEEYLDKVDVKDLDNNKKEIQVTLKFHGKESAIHDVKRISKFSQRIYKGAKDIRPIKRGYGMLVLTTPQGVVSDEFARENNIGGEALFQIW